MSDNKTEYLEQATRAKALLDYQAEMLKLFETQNQEIKDLVYQHNTQRQTLREKFSAGGGI